MVASGTVADDREISGYDIVIAGAGYVGLATALSIATARPSLRIAVVDAAPSGAWKKDGRASAIAASARRMLATLGCWGDLEGSAQAINEMIVTDSRTSDPVRPIFLNFGGPDPADHDGSEPFAHMVANVDLNGVLRRLSEACAVETIEGVGVVDFKNEGATTILTLADGRALRTRLLVAADGVRSRLREKAGIRTLAWDYGQSGIVCTVIHERPHHGRAEEHFLPAGPFAILPLFDDAAGRHRSSIVWTERTADAERIVAEDDFIFEAELELRFGLKLGEIRAEGPRRTWPLGLMLARDFVRPRFALVGDAAHGIHPIAGQGLNLGFKDAAALAEIIVEADRLGEDIGSLDVLERYQRWRRFDTVLMGATTDVLNRLFSNDIGSLRMLRDIGLGLVDRMPAAKRFFIGQAAGEAGNGPRLLAGEAI